MAVRADDEGGSHSVPIRRFMFPNLMLDLTSVFLSKPVTSSFRFKF